MRFFLSHACVRFGKSRREGERGKEGGAWGIRTLIVSGGLRQREAGGVGARVEAGRSGAAGPLICVEPSFNRSFRGR